MSSFVRNSIKRGQFAATEIASQGILLALCLMVLHDALLKEPSVAVYGSRAQQWRWVTSVGTTEVTRDSIYTEIPAMDMNALTSRVQSVLKDPKGFWSTASQETADPKEVLLNYAIPLVAAAQAASFVKLAIFGIHIPLIGTVRVPVMNALMQSVMTFVVAIGMFFLASYILNALAPKFGGSTTQPRCFQLVAYGATAGMVGQILSIVPVVGWFLSLGLGIYGLYTLFLGVTPMTNVPDNKRVPYIIVAFVCSAIVSAILMWVLVPHYAPDPMTLDLSTGRLDTRDLDAAAKSAQEFLKSLPQTQNP